MRNLVVVGWAVPALASLVSLLIRRPWTAIPARRRQPRAFWSMPVFHETNMLLTAAWTGYFALAALVTLAAPWVSVLLGLASWPFSEASHRFGSWYSLRRLATQPATR